MKQLRHMTVDELFERTKADLWQQGEYFHIGIDFQLHGGEADRIEVTWYTERAGLRDISISGEWSDVVADVNSTRAKRLLEAQGYKVTPPEPAEGVAQEELRRQEAAANAILGEPEAPPEVSGWPDLPDGEPAEVPA